MSNHIVYAVNDTEWEAYKAKFRKYYSPNEEKQRRVKWAKTISIINKHNQDYAFGKVPFILYVNQYTDGTRPPYGIFNRF